MTPQQIIDQARNKYNAAEDDYWSDEELLYLIYFACKELAYEAHMIERKYTAATVAGTREYSIPTTGTLGIKRITYNGCPLSQIDFHDDDVLTGNLESTTAQGTPLYYQIWDDTIMLRPVPDNIGSLVVYTINEPQELEIDSELEIPTRYHHWLVDYLVGEMFAKEKDFSGALFYQNRWMKNLQEAKKWKKRQQNKDGYAVVKCDEMLNQSLLGRI